MNDLDSHRMFRAVASGLAAALVCVLTIEARAQTEAPEVPTEASEAPVPRPESPPSAKGAPPPPEVASPRLDEPASPTEIPAPSVSTVEPRTLAPTPSYVSIWPGARLDVDGGAFRGDEGASAAFLVRRARLQATGWIGDWVYFSSAVEYALAPGVTTASLTPTDVFIALAPRGERIVLQVGQFDAPFSLENRTVDYALDFLERSIAVRDFGVPENKATGAMLTGVGSDRHFHYALGVFNGDGPGLRSVDDQFDFMARAWLAPFSFVGDSPLRALSIGGSLWVGDRANALPLDAQTTSGGFAFARFDPYTTTTGSAPRQLRQVGRRVEAAVELDAPVSARYGARAEMLWRRSPLSEEDVSDSQHPNILGGADLDGWAAYGEAWFWAFGDERAAPVERHGLESFTPREGRAATPSRDGLMLALRVSHVAEEVWQETDAALLNLHDPAVGVTTVTSYELGINYWHARALRATCSYVINRISGTTPEVKSFSSSTEQELLLRLGIAL
jgi:phosphate-selective porin O/P